ncbi:oligomeric Golgi complex subunit 6 [Lentinula edodes]|uniref:oligomeric Golgi complex subunit 6 n=1 Tax=Lentinula edodes TaxID=5353 RepID=UPI001E8D16B1|nr:oligomeric Golgi complex subunit 6 [Lentinula edodes]KAH7871193.1 oligomeric Golgi complex subunit 6 [Lentinula edodes]
MSGPIPYSDSSSSISSQRKSSSSWTSQARNPVSLRLYKVLGINFDDEATREALQTLSELYVNSSSSGSTVDASSKVKETPKSNAHFDGALLEDGEDEDDDEEERAQSSTGTSKLVENTPGEAAARARKNLKRDMELRLAEGSRHFLKVLSEVDERLVALQKHVSAMHTSCDEAEKQLQLSNEASKSLLERAGNLREERQEVEDRKSIVSLFLSRFTLTEEETEALTSRDVPVGKRFFQAMDKTEQIREDCRVLMAGEDGPTRAGKDIMASTASQLEQGYEKIFRWCSYEFRQVGRDSQLEVSTIMREGVRRLRKRPELLNESLAALSLTRQTTLTSSFLTALTRGGPSGLPRPIELHAHDPLRYIGDMLAWVHQAIAAEREFLEALFSIKEDGRLIGSAREFAEKGKMSEEEEWIRELMDAAVGKVCVPLKIRVQQTIRSQESSIMSYKIANLLQFYKATMTKTIGDDAVLSVTLKEITDLAYQTFFGSIEAQCRSLAQATLDLDDTSLTPPIPILDHVQILREIMAVYQSYLGDDELDDGDDEDNLIGDHNKSHAAGNTGFLKIGDVMVQPALDMCLDAGETKKRQRPEWDKDVFVLNCLSYLLSVLEPFAFTKPQRKVIQEAIESKVEELTEEHYLDIMTDAGLNQVASLCRNHDDSEPLSHVPGIQPAQLQSALASFSRWLSTSIEVVSSSSPRLSRLTLQRLHTQIHHAALERMAKAYGMICERVRRKENKYEAAATLLGAERPFGQVGLLWQIFGLKEEEE